MNGWFTSNLGDAMLAGEPLEHIKELFLSEYPRNSSLSEHALFIRHESEGASSLRSQSLFFSCNRCFRQSNQCPPLQ